jgi:hypothetical protein
MKNGTKTINKRVLAIGSLATLAFGSMAMGATKSEAYYRMGESFDGARDGEECVIEMPDETGNMPLAVHGKVYYSKDVPPAKKMNIKNGSKLSVKLDQSKFGGFKATSPIFKDRDNNGFEAWIKFSAKHKNPSNYVNIITSGNGAQSVNIAIGDNDEIGPHVQNHWGEPDFPFTRDEWMHIAIVNDGGMFSFYMNGDEVTNKALGIKDLSSSSIAQIGFFMDGWLDEVRFFSFKSGEFDPKKDLNYK